MALLFSDKSKKVKISRCADGYSIATPFLSITALPLTDTNPNDKIIQDVIIPLVSSRVSPITFLRSFNKEANNGIRLKEIIL